MAVGLPALSHAQQWPYGPGMMRDHGWMGMILGPFMMIIFIVVLVAAVVLLLRWLGGPPHAHGPYPPAGKSAIDILKERFARGEIDKQEFEDRRKTLGE
jgi:putative membrane protein